MSTLECSPYLLRRKRTIGEVLAARQGFDAQLAEFVACVDRAALEAARIAESLERHTQEGTVKRAAEEWRNVQSMLGDPDDGLWHDHITPAQELLREVYGEDDE